MSEPIQHSIACGINPTTDCPACQSRTEPNHPAQIIAAFASVNGNGHATPARASQETHNPEITANKKKKPPARTQQAAPAVADDIHLTDKGNAKRVVKRHGQ